jgi:uncharacterized protein
MLVSFSVGNFRSFGREATLNMVASKRVHDHPRHRISIPNTDRELLRAAVIYGANAAGKSNLIKAMRFAQGCVSGERLPIAQKFRFDDEFASKPSTFEFRFLIGERIFIYGFDVDGRQIEQEWLSVIQGNAEVEIFTRKADGTTEVGPKAAKLFEATDPTMFQTLDALVKLPLKSHQTFLNRASSIPAASQGKTLAAIVRWLTQDLVILTADHRSRDILDRLQNDESFRSFCKTFLSSIGTGVSDLHVALHDRDADEIERHFLTGASGRMADGGLLSWGLAPHSDARPDPKNPSRIVVRTLVAEHRANTSEPSYMPFAEESDGTQQLLHLMPVLFPFDTETRVVVELDRSLHPLICWMFINFFSESCPEARRQLIVTTHEVHLLNQELLRRDEFWFIEKNEQQQSVLSSLVDFKIRKDLQIEKGYLDGRFGAIPTLGGVAALQEMLECEERSESERAKNEAST